MPTIFAFLLMALSYSIPSQCTEQTTTSHCLNTPRPGQKTVCILLYSKTVETLNHSNCDYSCQSCISSTAVQREPNIDFTPNANVLAIFIYYYQLSYIVFSFSSSMKITISSNMLSTFGIWQFHSISLHAQNKKLVNNHKCKQRREWILRFPLPHPLRPSATYQDSVQTLCTFVTRANGKRMGFSVCICFVCYSCKVHK